ncbi:hypothetical protein Mapa_000223 [Marchantia paleacea]|nr:hypothetical protein Mapa_000223 [Marchantia paleacea]
MFLHLKVLRINNLHIKEAVNQVKPSYAHFFQIMHLQRHLSRLKVEPCQRNCLQCHRSPKSIGTGLFTVPREWYHCSFRLETP